MISLCILVRDTPNLYELIDMWRRNYKGEIELCIADNSTDEGIREDNKDISDVYVPISDKELFRMGIPWAHNKLAAQCNTYKIAYIDSDEYPVWINPELEKVFDLNYIVPTIRYDFLTTERIYHFDRYNLSFNQYIDRFDLLRASGEVESKSIQDRFYNCRYVQFNGVCHSVFHAPDHFRGNTAGAILLHNKTVRDAKDKKRMDELIDEQYARQNVNPRLTSSSMVMQWGRGMIHKYEDFEAFDKAYK